MADMDATRHVHLELSGELDAATVPDEFDRVINAELAPGDFVTLNTSDVAFIDSTGVAMLLRIRDYLTGMGCQLELSEPSGAVTRVLTLLGLTEQFEVTDT